MNKVTIDDLKLAGKRVLVRVDFNVPLKDGMVADDSRIQGALPTIKRIVAAGGRAILMSHLGRPKGQRKPELSLAPVADHLRTLVNFPVKAAPDTIGPEVEKMVADLKRGQVLLLENLRFYAEEEMNDPEFAKKLAALGDVFINDAFGTAHRAHASTEGIVHYMDSAGAGYLLQKELDYLGGLQTAPAQPYVAVIGGAKVSGKLEILEQLIPRVDALLIGGGMAYTFLKAKNVGVGSSLVEDDLIDHARSIMARAGEVELCLPDDHLIATGMSEESESEFTSGVEISEGWMGVDIGPKSIEHYRAVLSGAKTVLWNGPMGVFENPKFAAGTFAIADELARITTAGATTVVGGGDSVAAIRKRSLTDAVTHVSTGGGASLEYLSGKELPGVEVLPNK